MLFYLGDSTNHDFMIVAIFHATVIHFTHHLISKRSHQNSDLPLFLPLYCRYLGCLHPVRSALLLTLTKDNKYNNNINSQYNFCDYGKYGIFNLDSNAKQ